MVAAHTPIDEAGPTLPLQVKARTSAEALAEVRARLGDDAVILKTTTVRDAGSGARFVQVEATLDEPVTSPSISTSTLPPEPARRRSLLRVPTAPPQASDTFTESFTAVLEELRALRSELSTQKADNRACHSELRTIRNQMRDVENAVSGLSSEHAIIREYGIPAEWVPAYRRLNAAAIDAQIAEDILREAVARLGSSLNDPIAAHETLIECVSRRIKTKPILGQAVSPPVVSAVGPAGSGKTSAIAKIAAHAVLKGATQIAIVILEGAGSIEALSRVAGALGVPITTVQRTPGALARKVCELQAQGVDLVLVDTPAISIRDRDQNAALWREIGTVPGAEILLVLNATTRELELCQTAIEIARFGFHRFVFTHVEEALRTGAILSAIAATDRPIAALSSGPRVPDDLQLPDPRALAEAMVVPPRVEAARKRQ